MVRSGDTPDLTSCPNTSGINPKRVAGLFNYFFPKEKDRLSITACAFRRVGVRHLELAGSVLPNMLCQPKGASASFGGCFGKSSVSGFPVFRRELHSVATMELRSRCQKARRSVLLTDPRPIPGKQPYLRKPYRRVDAVPSSRTDCVLEYSTNCFDRWHETQGLGTLAAPI